jgi:hypothetical protein
MIIDEIGGQETSEMPLTADDHVVETFAPEGSDQSLRIWILPRADGLEMTSPVPMPATRHRNTSP